MELTQAALSLNEEERYTLLECLRDSIPGSDPALYNTNEETAWRRLQTYQTHPEQVTPWRDALASLRAKYTTNERLGAHHLRLPVKPYPMDIAIITGAIKRHPDPE